MAQLDIQAKLAILADAAKYDASCASSGSVKCNSRGGTGVGSSAPGMGICHAYAPDGRCISLLKILLTNSCIFDCAYCINRKSSNARDAEEILAQHAGDLARSTADRTARTRELEMIDRSVAREGLEHALEAERAIEPKSNLRASWETLLEEARGCTRCDLYRCGTQTVFGEGPLDAGIMFVGEQPGDQEDIAGRPFVGPAGQLFDAALEKAGIDRSSVYVTNAVKHFKFIQRGKRRIHNKPDAGEITACRWWIEHERALIRPPITVALGATAARSLVGKVVTISKVRGEPLPLADGSECWVTAHPSSILRAPDDETRKEDKKLFLRDLKRIKARAEELTR